MKVTGILWDSRPLKQLPMESEAPVTTALAPDVTSLNASDRCDRCGAQAYLRFELAGGGELHFCAHHAREHGDKLREIAINVVDESHKLDGTPNSAPSAEH